ncbi:hypothetical protein K4749_12330 [Streptomyces sp. TRM72054]|uniref:hypothetical protein n=1 Tax=Streptomyces sp. TRM72054 TaxID=2870562 RepID=UPI001C8CCBF2|nr:hypothetical protein [Streptomyces sp. TRM72054]MBX9394367.1 hypothetical protein [Streptomyces sp. TRM72054]
MRISALHAAAVLAAGTLAFGSGTAFADTPSVPAPQATDASASSGSAAAFAGTPSTPAPQATDASASSGSAAAFAGTPSTPSPQATDAPASPASAAHVAVDAPTIAPGGTVHINGTCAVTNNDLAPKLISITSPGFVDGTLKVTKDMPDAFTADATAVKTSGGPYQVTATCSNGTVSTSFTVESPTPDPSPTPKPTRSPGRASKHTDSGGSDSGGGTHHDGIATPSPRVIPNGAPATGEFDPAGDSSNPTVHVGEAVGAALGGFLVGTGGAGLVLRRRRTGSQR